VSGVGASQTTSTKGGDSAALGAAIFFGSGSNMSIIISGSSNFNGNTTSNGDGQGFSGVGNDIFLYSGTTLSLSPTLVDDVITVGSILDNSIQSIPDGQTWTPGINEPAGGSLLVANGSGTVRLVGHSRYVGSTQLDSGTTTLVNSSLYAGGVGAGSAFRAVSVNRSARLNGAGLIRAPTTVDGTIAPSNPVEPSTAALLQVFAPLVVTGTLEFTIYSDGTAPSSITTSSTANLSGANVQLLFSPGIYTSTNQYLLLSSDALIGARPQLLPLPDGINGQLVFTSNSMSFELLPPVPPVPPVPTSLAPFVSTISPSRGTSGVRVVITGRNFTSLAAVFFGTVASTSFTIVSDSSIIVVVPPRRSNQQVSMVNVRVTTNAGTSSAFATNVFTYMPKPPRTVWAKHCQTHKQHIYLRWTAAAAAKVSNVAISYIIYRDSVAIATVRAGHPLYFRDQSLKINHARYAVASVVASVASTPKFAVMKRCCRHR
jgi:hypothetical protein